MPVQPVATLVEVAGDHASAVVLSQIMYWHQGGKLKVERKGSYWLAKSRAELCAETKITLDQYKRIMPRLVQRGLIVMERGLFKNKVTPHIQLTPEGMTAMAKVYSPSSKSRAKDTSRLGASKDNPRLVSDDANDLVQESTQESTTEKDLATKTVAQSGQDQEGKEGEGIGGEDQDPEGEDLSPDLPIGGTMKAADILKAHTAPLSGSLGGFWKSRMKLIGHEGYQKNLTGQELGQLKHLSKALGDQTKAVIDYAICNWSKFASLAGIAAGVQPPDEPHIGFLLKHHDVAMNLLMPVVAPPQAIVEKPVQLIASNAETEPAHILTPEEFTEIMQSFKTP